MEIEQLHPSDKHPRTYVRTGPTPEYLRKEQEARAEGLQASFNKAESDLRNSRERVQFLEDMILRTKDMLCGEDLPGASPLGLIQRAQLALDTLSRLRAGAAGDKILLRDAQSLAEDQSAELGEARVGAKALALRVDENTADMWDILRVVGELGGDPLEQLDAVDSICRKALGGLTLQEILGSVQVVTEERKKCRA